METHALIVAAGRGTRAGGPVPKQWQILAGQPVLARTLAVFRAHPAIAALTLVLHPDDFARARELGPLLEGVRLVPGGASRAASVRAGLEAMADAPPGRVLIHDVARPLLPADVIDRVIAALEATPGAAPALAVTDALWRGADGRVTGVQDRAGLYRAQTPQGFHFDTILAAHRALGAEAGDAADDVEVARRAGLAVAIVAGDEDNFKITLPGDLARAERLLARRGAGVPHEADAPGPASPAAAGVLPDHAKADAGTGAATMAAPAHDSPRATGGAGSLAPQAGPQTHSPTLPQKRAPKQENAMDIRTGQGFDVHAFCPGDRVTLCGVEIAHDAALRGHSDADVGLHALTDALYGALGAGDIGRHFPPSDPQWKGAASDIFLRHAASLVAQGGYRIANVDVTLICEAPKIGPHAAEMRDRVGDIIGLEADRISIKATTSERLGFTGRGEGIAAMAIATIIKE